MTINLDWPQLPVLSFWKVDKGWLASGGNVKTFEGYKHVNFEVASSSSFRDIPKNHFVTAAAADIDDRYKRKRV